MKITMDPKLQKEIIISAVAIVILLVILGLSFGWFSGSNTSPMTQGGQSQITRDIITPDVNSTVFADVAKPFNTVPVGPSTFRQFNVSVENGKYIPDTIVVNDGDIVDIWLTAVDANHNFYIPRFSVSMNIPKGERKEIQFQGTPSGQYEFYCKDVCRGNVKGTLIVNPVEK